jgi:hypothetical protein
MTPHAHESSIWPSIAWLIVFLTGAATWIAISYLLNWNGVTVRKHLSRESAEKTLAKVPETYDYIPADASSVPGLRQDELQRYTETLERLGFHQLADSALLGSSEATPHAFGRCLVNEETRCFAE